MKKPSFAIISFILSLVLTIPAVLIFLVVLLQIGESNPLSFIAFLFVVIATLPELPLFSISLKLGFPIVLPSLATIFAIISLKKKEGKNKMAITSIAFVAVSIGIYLLVRNLF